MEDAPFVGHRFRSRIYNICYVAIIAYIRHSKTPTFLTLHEIFFLVLIFSLLLFKYYADISETGIRIWNPLRCLG